MDRRIRDHFPETFNLPVKFPKFRADFSGMFFCRTMYRFIKEISRFTCFFIVFRFMCRFMRLFIICHFARLCFCRRFDLCQLLCVQPHKRRCQHRRKRKILPHIIQNFQIIQKNADLIRFKISLPASRISRNPLLSKHRCVHIRPAFDASGQDHNIPVLRPPKLSGLFIHHHTILHQFPDTMRNDPRFQFFCFHIPCRIYKQKFRLKLRCAVPPHHRFKCRSRVKSRLIIVADPSQFLSHDPPENIICSVQHFRPAPEIFVKIDPLAHTVVQTVCVVFLHKQFRSGKPEPVNTLLHIPDHENIIVSAAHRRYTCQDRLLDQVAVLILIDHHFGKLLLIFSRRHGRLQFPIHFFC